MVNTKLPTPKVRRPHPPHLLRVGFIMVVIVLCFSLYFDSQLQVPPVVDDRMIHLESGWSVSIDDEIFNSDVLLPVVLDQKVEGKEVRATTTLPEEGLEGINCLAVHTSMTSLDVLLDGQTIYSFGHTGGWKKPVLGGGYTQFIDLPDGYEGAPLTLVYHFTSDNAFSGAIEVPILAQKSTLIVHELREWPSLVFGGMFLLIGAAAVAVSFRFSERNVNRSILYFGLIECALGAWVVTQTSCKFFIVANPIMPLNFSIIALFLLPYFLVQYVNNSYRIIRRKTKGFLYISYGFITAYIAGGLGQLTGLFEYTDLISIAGLSLGLYIISLTTVLIIDYFEGNRELITFIYAIAVLLVTVGAEELLLLLQVNPDDAVLLHLGMGISGSIMLFQTLRVISQHRQTSFREQKLLELALTDSLTGLNNRMAYDNQIEQIMKNKKYYDVIGVIVCDINDLKKMNDTYGHSCGDEVLKDFAYQIIRLVPYGSDVYRIGGDEFVAFIPRVTEEQLILIAQSILDHPLRVSYGPYTVSVGAKRCSFTNPCNLVNVITEADKRMYECKKRMKNGSMAPERTPV